MAMAKVLLHLGETTGKCILVNAKYHKPSVEMQTSWRQARGFKRIRDMSKPTQSLSGNGVIGMGAMKPKLWKSFGFTIAFSGASMVAASIWEYERMHRYTHWVINKYQLETQRRRSGWRGDAERWWNGLADGQRVFASICFLNVVVFLGWRIPALKNTMNRYFCADPSSSAICWPMLLSTFSHRSVIHLAANMYVLHTFSTIAVSSLGKEQFVAFYLTSGVVSSLVSNIFKTAISMPGPTIGASGAIMGVVSFICTQYPDMMLSIVFLPMWAFSTGAAIKGLMAIDAMGCILRWKFIDHAAHLGGACFGLFWQAWGSSNLWQKREPIVKCWHKIREPPRTS